jgi:site-specific DNA-cytosine methylase
MKKIVHYSVLPLFGGMALGMSEAFGSKPKASFSWSPFAKNDSSFEKNFNIKNILLDQLDDASFSGLIDSYKKPNVVHCVPPCAGLSMLNSGGAKNQQKKRGSDAEQNKWMYSVLDFGMKLDSQVIVFENAPGFAQKAGEGLRDAMVSLAKENGYSFSLILTDTLLHGVPQSRKRTFAIFWKSPEAPQFERVTRSRESLRDFLKNHSVSTTEDSVFPYKKELKEDPFMSFLLHKYRNDWRRVLNDQNKNSMSIGYYLKEKNLFDEAIAFGDKKQPKLAKIIRYWKSKLDKGMGYWDASPIYYKDHTNAIITKNWSIIHPTEDRWLSLREMMTLMGLPESYSHAQPNHINAVCQNVPVCTAKDIGLHIKDFINGKTKSSGKIFYMFDNIKGVEI